jgi:hypothetical protein
MKIEKLNVSHLSYGVHQVWMAVKDSPDAAPETIAQRRARRIASLEARYLGLKVTKLETCARPHVFTVEAAIKPTHVFTLSCLMAEQKALEDLERRISARAFAPELEPAIDEPTHRIGFDGNGQLRDAVPEANSTVGAGYVIETSQPLKPLDDIEEITL